MENIKETDKIVHKGYLTLVQRPFNGMMHDIVVCKDSVILLYIDENDQVYLARQFSPGLDHYVLTLPSETLDKPDLTPKEVAAEGLEEECGIKIDKSKVNYIGRLYSSVGHDTEATHMFSFTGHGEHVGQRLNDYEDIDVVKMSFDDLYQMVMKNEIHDSKTNYLVLYEKLRRLGEIS